MYQTKTPIRRYMIFICRVMTRLWHNKKNVQTQILKTYAAFFYQTKAFLHTDKNFIFAHFFPLFENLTYSDLNSLTVWCCNSPGSNSASVRNEALSFIHYFIILINFFVRKIWRIQPWRHVVQSHWLVKRHLVIFLFFFFSQFFSGLSSIFRCTTQFLSFVILRHFFRNKLFTVSRFVYFVQKQTLAGKILLMQGPIFSMHDWLLIHFPNLSCSCAANFPASVFIKICSLLQSNFTIRNDSSGITNLKCFQLLI